MRQSNRFGWVRRATTLVVAAGVTSPAFAYIDPGTGSMLLQVIGAGIAGGIFYFRELRYKILAMFSRRPAASVEEGDDRTSDEPPR